MKLYYRPAACSQAANIALREAALKFELVKVDRKTRRTADGLDYYEVNSRGYVPSLRLDNGEVLTENIAVLLYIADCNPAAKLAPPAGTLERYHLIEWLSFITSELHKGFSPLFSAEASADVKQYARNYVTTRLEQAQHMLGAKTWVLGEQFSVADAYLFVVLSWAAHVDVDIGKWPQLKRLQERVAARPHTIEALKSEGLAK